MNVIETLKALGPSIIRTVTSWIIGWVVTLLAVHFNITWDPDPVIVQAVATVVGLIWYALFRILEEKVSPKFGWLLGLPGPPTYQAPVQPPPDPPDDGGAPGYQATADAVDPAGDPIPEGTPVDVVPSDPGMPGE